MSAAVPDVLAFGDTIRFPELRHEVPIVIPDGFLYAERDGKRYAVVSSFELPRVRELAEVEAITSDDLGWTELLADGVPRDELYLHLAERACRRLGIESAVVPPSFPFELADYLRAAGIELEVDRALFTNRRRRKNAAELAGIRRAQRAAEAAMEMVRDHLRRASADNGVLTLDGEPLTSERIKRAINDVFNAHDCAADESIVSHGPQSAVGHEMGSGAIAPGEPIVVDLFPRDRETACYADMTRTYVVGTPPEELVEYHRLCLEALQEALGSVRAGASGHEMFKRTCDLFAEHGYKTLMNKQPDETLEEGFVHSLGHGVGLELHEQPGLSLAAGEELVAGDVITIEPGLYRPGFGGCRLEDLVLVTDGGAENLTDYPYDLAP
jgi:Xaa-Pro aminopeptidase